MALIRGVLLDVGGTLWPQHGPPIAATLRAERIIAQFPGISPRDVDALLAALASAPEPEDGGQQDIYAYLSDVATVAGLQLAVDDLERLRRALCLPAHVAMKLFPNADTLLRAIKAMGLRCAIVSNALVRTGADYADDFEGFGLADCVTAWVSSLDVHMRKPHSLPFQQALNLIGCAPSEAAMVGDNERNDIVPAKSLGMRTVRVCIEPRPPSETVADVLATDLLQVRDILKKWAEGPST
jgi:HAD superfamily hydrolase (TIGR01509 family)